MTRRTASPVLGSVSAKHSASSHPGRNAPSLWSALLILGAAFVPAACAPYSTEPSASPLAEVVLVFHNRSATQIALYPGVVIEPCSTMVFDRSAVDRGNLRLQEEFLRTGTSDGWVPRGAALFAAGIPGRPDGAAAPMSVVASSQPLQVGLGSIDPSELPPCGGMPLGIDGGE